MPGFDGTGPRGMGPMTGGGRGFCALPLGMTPSQPFYPYASYGMGYGAYGPGYGAYGPGYGMGYGPGWGMRPRWGRGMGMGRGMWGGRGRW